jgi:hypothetical protein
MAIPPEVTWGPVRNERDILERIMTFKESLNGIFFRIFRIILVLFLGLGLRGCRLWSNLSCLDGHGN